MGNTDNWGSAGYILPMNIIGMLGCSKLAEMAKANDTGKPADGKRLLWAIVIGLNVIGFTAVFLTGFRWFRNWPVLWPTLTMNLVGILGGCYARSQVQDATDDVGAELQQNS